MASGNEPIAWLPTLTSDSSGMCEQNHNIDEMLDART